ncbi:MAG: hypothetical protein OXG84_05505 [Chloroflexi bacterium]|nr:hypothetical protein [Chloroflexota bacterium]
MNDIVIIDAIRSPLGNRNGRLRGASPSLVCGRSFPCPQSN